VIDRRVILAQELHDAIATDLYISVSTVKTHVSSILRKLDADNRVQALSIARERGLLV